MKFVSTRAKAPGATLSQAIEEGLASDGGLFVPSEIPTFELKEFSETASLPEIAQHLLAPFFKGDALQEKLPAMCRNALSFPTPLKFLENSNCTAVLELFHGPTAAFKDIGARFLSECFSEMPASDGVRTILVATSGDTGGAVASAFHLKPGIEVVVLFPKGGVSPLQEKQLTCWGDNVRAFAVRGTFDDCQRLVKGAFAERTPNSGRHLTSANSINLGRILPQAVYYASSSLEYFRKTGKKPGFVIPSGNVGNAMAALWAMKMGFPIRELLLATNANRVVPDYFESGEFKARPSLKTLANAMDVGNPSNLERITQLTGSLSELKKSAQAISVTDQQIRGAIQEGYHRFGQIWCPHTAAACFARTTQSSAHWIVAATAHPAKFNDVVEPLLGRPAHLPRQLEELVTRPSHFEELEPKLEALLGLLT